MTVSAAIFFKQGVSVSAPGVALIGTTGTPVTVKNGNDTNVAEWVWEVIDVPPTSTVPVGVQLDGSITSFTFTPDVSGGYELHLITRDVFGNFAEDFRVFQVPEASGRIIPPFRATDKALNFIIMGNMNVRGWATFQEAYNREVDLLGGGGGATFDTVQPGVNADVIIVSVTTNVFVPFSGLTATRTALFPAAPGTGQRIRVGIIDASGLSHGVTVGGNGKVIGSRGTATYAIVGSLVAVDFEYDGTQWRVVNIAYPALPAIDANTQIQWSFGEVEHNAAVQYANTGNGGALSLAPNRGTTQQQFRVVSPTGPGLGQPTIGQPPILFAPPPAALWPGTPESTTIGESASITLHGWVFIRTFPAASDPVICYKIYHNDSWSAPFTAIGFALVHGATNGDWQGFATFGGGVGSVTGQVLQTALGTPVGIPLSTWTHLAITVSTATGGNLFINGENTSVTLANAAQALDFGTHGPWEMLGETVGDSQFFDGSVAEWRVDNVVRSDTYLKIYVQQTLRALPLVA